MAGVGGAHQAELEQKLRSALSIGAAVHDDGLSPRLVGHGGAHGRPADPLDPLDQQGGPGEQGPGGAGGHKGIPLPLGEHFQAHHHGGVLPLMDHGAGIVVHIHHILGVGDLHALGKVGNAVLAQHLQDLLPPAHQGDLQAIGFGSLQRTQYGCLGGKIAAHRVKNNLHFATSFFRSPRKPSRR